jgi:hypothetical protein
VLMLPNDASRATEGHYPLAWEAFNLRRCAAFILFFLASFCAARGSLRAILVGSPERRSSDVVVFWLLEMTSPATGLAGLSFC